MTDRVDYENTLSILEEGVLILFSLSKFITIVKMFEDLCTFDEVDCKASRGNCPFLLIILKLSYLNYFVNLT